VCIWVRCPIKTTLISCVLCSWARHFTLTEPFATQVNKWVWWKSPSFCTILWRCFFVQTYRLLLIGVTCNQFGHVANSRLPCHHACRWSWRVFMVSNMPFNSVSKHLPENRPPWKILSLISTRYLCCCIHGWPAQTFLETGQQYLLEKILTNVFILLHVRSNKTLYDDVSLIPLPADYQPSVQQLPGTGTGLDKGKMRGQIMRVTWKTFKINTSSENFL